MKTHESPEMSGLYWVVDDDCEVIEGPFFEVEQANEWIRTQRDDD